MAERIRTESDSEKTEGKMVHADEYLEYTAHAPSSQLHEEEQSIAILTVGKG